MESIALCLFFLLLWNSLNKMSLGIAQEGDAGPGERLRGAALEPQAWGLQRAGGMWLGWGPDVLLHAGQKNHFPGEFLLFPTLLHAVARRDDA